MRSFALPTSLIQNVYIELLSYYCCFSGVDSRISLVWWYHSKCGRQGLHETLLPTAWDPVALRHSWEGKLFFSHTQTIWEV